MPETAISKHFHLPQRDAARVFNVGTSTFKRFSQTQGVERSASVLGDRCPLRLAWTSRTRQLACQHCGIQCRALSMGFA